MKATTLLTILLKAILWAPIVFFSLLLTHNAVLYFTHGGEYGILPEKIVARQDWIWNLSFYIHLPAGILCLLAPLLLFARNLLKRIKNLHTTVGRIYVWTTLYIVCPTGIYLALYAKGGLTTQVGFVIQAVLLAWFTWKGYRAIRENDRLLHVQHMIRSYSVAAVVLTFRIYHIIFFLLKLPYQDNYAISQWLGLFGNLLLAEIIIALTFQTKKSFHLKSQNYERV